MALSYQLCQSMLGLLIEDTRPPWLTRLGVQAIDAARLENAFLRENSTRCLPEARGVEFFTYAGGHLNLVIARALAVGLRAETHGSDLSVFIDKSAGVSWFKIRSCLAVLDRKGLLENAKPSPQWLTQLKFSACLPEDIAIRVFVERLDLEGWEEIAAWLRSSPTQA